MTISFARPRLTEQVAAHMTGMITAGTWAAGMALLPEAELAQQFGVSRTVVRECVRVLASRGMLNVRQGRGTFVTPPTAWNVTEPLALLVRADRSSLLRWLEVRTILEVESAALAARRATDDDRTALEAALRRLESGAADMDASMEADIALHLTIARATGNPALARLLEPMVQPMRDYLQETALLHAAVAAAALEHRAIVRHVLAGDVEGARGAMEGHLARVADEIAEVLRRHADEHEKPGREEGG